MNRLLTIAEAAKLLGIGKTLLYDLMERGELAFVKVGRCRRLQEIQITEFIARNTIGGIDARKTRAA